MAARLNPKNDERARAAIQTTQLCKRLNAFALGEDDPCANKPIECVMSSDQVRAALGLLKKTIPDLAVTSHTGPDGGPVLIVTGVDRDYVEPDTNTKPGFQD
jgi:hypothetical protein